MPIGRLPKPCCTPSEESVMFSGLFDNLRRNIGVRLSLWYAAMFTASSVGLLSLAYYLLAGALVSKDREVLDARLKEAAAEYKAGGIPALGNWVQRQPPESVV